MNPCREHQESMALLAAGALSTEDAALAHAHLQTCDACRAYWQEMASVTELLGTAAVGPENVEASPALHRRVMKSIASEIDSPWWSGFVAQIRAGAWNLAAGGVMTVALVLMVVWFSRPRTAPIPMPVQTVKSIPARPDFEPTFANYQTVANRSLEKLDELMTAQGIRSLPPALVGKGAGLTD